MSWIQNYLSGYRSELSTFMGFHMLISAMEVLIRCQSIIYSKIKVILHSLIGDQGWFADGIEPTKNQLYSIGRLDIGRLMSRKFVTWLNHWTNTHEFGQKIVHYLTLPEKELESYVASTSIAPKSLFWVFLSMHDFLRQNCIMYLYQPKSCIIPFVPCIAENCFPEGKVWKTKARFFFCKNT